MAAAAAAPSVTGSVNADERAPPKPKPGTVPLLASGKQLAPAAAPFKAVSGLQARGIQLRGGGSRPQFV